jgi:hypothetical protein
MYYITPSANYKYYTENDTVGVWAPTAYVVFVDDDGDVISDPFPNIVSINWDSNDSAFCNTGSFKILNNSQNDWEDHNWFTPHRADSVKAENNWKNLLVPNRKIRIYAGYNDEFAPVFTGLICSTEITMENGNCYMTVLCRDMNKLLMDQTCNSTTISTNILSHEYILPIQTDIVSEFLDINDTDPYMDEIIIDICRRAGANANQVINTMSPIKLSDTNLILSGRDRKSVV